MTRVWEARQLAFYKSAAARTRIDLNPGGYRQRIEDVEDEPEEDTPDRWHVYFLTPDGGNVRAYITTTDCKVHAVILARRHGKEAQRRVGVQREWYGVQVRPRNNTRGVIGVPLERQEGWHTDVLIEVHPERRGRRRDVA